jgi:hypothetical protein
VIAKAIKETSQALFNVVVSATLLLDHQRNSEMLFRPIFALVSTAVVAAGMVLLFTSPASAQCPADFTCQTGLKGYDETVSMNVQIIYGNFNLPGVGMVYGGSGYDCDGAGGFVNPVFCCVKGAAAGSSQVMMHACIHE